MASEPNRLQRFVRRTAPGRIADRAERESKQWQVICVKCGQATSWWEMGGIRVGAYSRGKRLIRRCESCGRLRCHRVERWAGSAR